MVQIVLTNSDDVIIASAKADSQYQIIDIIAKWADEFAFLNGDSISFYNVKERD